MVILKEILLKNFKSFKGEAKVDNVLSFTAIVGSNGAGKSNFMDAISFAMGVKLSDMRVSRMEELVYRSCTGRYQDKMSVAVVLQSADGAETRFERSFRGSSSEHRINDKVVCHKDYVETLKTLGIHARIKNFLVFQNTIESIVTTSPVERTAMFEDISGSGSLATEYKRLKSRMEWLNQEVQYLQQNKRIISKEIKAMLYCKEKAHEYRDLEKNQAKAQLDLMLFNLYQIERNICKWSKTVNETSAKIVTLETEKCTAKETLRIMTKACSQYKYIVALTETDARAKEMELIEKLNELTKAESKTHHANSKVVSCKESLESAIKADKAHNEYLKQLEDALKTVEEKKYEYIQRFAVTLGRDWQLSKAQIKEYEHLKAMCYGRCIEYHQRQIILEREHKFIEDELESAMRRIKEMQSVLDGKAALHIACLKRAENFEELVKQIEHKLEAKCQYQSELFESLRSLKTKERNFNNELEGITQEIGDLKLNERIKEKNNIVNNLRQLYPGVLGRLRNMCRPIHSRYSWAVTKVIGRHLDSIVVKTSEIARRCIAYLKDQRIGIETFLPLDDIIVEPINQKLRAITDPTHVKLVYDVLNFHSNIEPVIQFVTHNTLVCENLEDAAFIAFAGGKSQHDCVSAEGILYRKSGLISGGTHDFLNKAQRWDSSSKIKLISRKSELITALQEIRIGLAKESELPNISSTILNLEKRLNDANISYRSAGAELAAIEFEMQDIEDEYDATMRYSEDIESRVSQSLRKIDQIKLRINEEENELFADFCNRIRVDNIRHYEEGQKIYNEAIQNFDRQIDRITEQLDDEKIRKTKDNVFRWERNLREVERELELYREQERLIRNTMEEEKKHFYDCETQYKDTKKSIEEESARIAELRKQIGVISKVHMTLSKHVNGMLTLIENKKAQRHSILTEAKMRGIKIPSIDGPPDDSSETCIELRLSGLSINESADVYEMEGMTKYDFSQLPRNLTTLESNVEIRAARENLEKSIADVADAMEAIGDPNMRASQEVPLLKKKLSETKCRLERSIKEARKASDEFELIKKDRYNKFMGFFEHASERVDTIYKELTRNPSAQAYLQPENPEEPYLAGIHYHCVPPGKQFQLASNLSGGERTLAALPLLFAAHSGDSPTFKVLDEIDASLDNWNTMKVMNYIEENKDVQQSIVISHKKEIFGGADALIGINTVKTENGVESTIVTLDLRGYAP